METVKITLKYPVSFDGVVRNELVMRRPKVRDMRTASKQAQGDD
ncbi:TPA: phage tail assembly protein, partial [Burkholderia vietnamiensis]|nr:phage tail assembly protein [Burkholderia vietnamiensis]